MRVSTHGSNVDLLHLVFGSILAIDNAALVLIAAVASMSLLTLAVIYRPLVVECFDPGFLRAVGGRGGPFLGARAVDAQRREQRLGVCLGFLVLLLSFHLDLPSRPSIVLVAGLAYFGSVLFSPRDSLRMLYLHRRQPAA